MSLIAVLVAVGLVAAAGLWRWSRRTPAGAGSSRTARPADRFAAVEIRRRSGACKAAHALEGQRFLAESIPGVAAGRLHENSLRLQLREAVGPARRRPSL